MAFQGRLFQRSTLKPLYCSSEQSLYG